MVLRLAVVSILLAAVAVGARHFWNESQEWTQRRRLQTLAEQAERAATPAAGKAVVRRIRDLPGDSIAMLVRLAASHQPGTSAAAREAINACLASWAFQHRQLGDAAVDNGTIATMANALAEHADRFTGPSIPWAQRTVNQILAEAESFDPQRMYEILSDCERAASTLARLSAESVGESSADATAAVRRNAAPSRSPADGVEQSAGAARFVAPETSALGAADSPAPSTLKIEEIADASVASPPTIKKSAPQGAPQGELTWNPGSSIGRVSPSDDGSGAHMAASPKAAETDESESEPGRPQQSNTASPPNVPSPFMDVPSPEVMRHADRRFRTMSNQQLLERLDAAKAESQRFVAAAAARELKQRGFDEAEIDLLAVQRTIDNGERKPTGDEANPIATRRRLYELTRHADPAVRRQALTLLATTGDPRLDEIARERMIDDEDPGVVETASRIWDGATQRR